MPAPTVALVSGDLLLASRLRAALRDTAVVRLAVVDDVPGEENVFIDLNADVDVRLGLIGALSARGGVRIIGFCPHDARDVRIRAMAMGADQVVTNGALQEAALRLVGAGSRG